MFAAGQLFLAIGHDQEVGRIERVIRGTFCYRCFANFGGRADLAHVAPGCSNCPLRDDVLIESRKQEHVDLPVVYCECLARG
jgi:hypothetical protein